VKGFPSRASKRGTLLKNVILQLLALIMWKWLQIGIDLLHTIRSTGVRFVNIDDFEWLQTPKRVLLWICSQFLATSHILRVNCMKFLDIDKDNVHMKCSALNVDFSSLGFNPLGSRRPVQVGVKDGNPPKNGYFATNGSCSMKTVTDRHRHAAYHNKQ